MRKHLVKKPGSGGAWGKKNPDAEALVKERPGPEALGEKKSPDPEALGEKQARIWSTW